VAGCGSCAEACPLGSIGRVALAGSQSRAEAGCVALAGSTGEKFLAAAQPEYVFPLTEQAR
jgi:Fe-S-cluster-containing hydrogenase component 2